MKKDRFIVRIVNYFILYTLIAFALQAQTITTKFDEINFKHLSVEDGLSSSTVYAILQDSRGFMWFGTNKNINRWDGYKIKIYTLGVITTLYEDTQGVMWVGTMYGLNKFNRETEDFTRYVINDDSIDNVLQNIIYEIIEDNSGALWIATGYGLCRFDAATGKVKRFIPKPEDPKPAFSDNYIMSVSEIEKDRLLLGTRNGLISFNTETGEFTKLPFNDPAVDNKPHINKVYKDRAGNLWLGMAWGGLIQYNIENAEFDRYLFNSENPSSLSNNFIETIHEDQSGKLWIGTSGGGLNKFNRDTKRFTAYNHNSRDAASIGSSSIQAIYDDKDGNLWIGTFDNGISMISKWGKPFKHYMHDTEDASSLGDGKVMAICEARSGDLWVAQWGSGISRLISGSKKFIHYVYNSSAQISIGSDNVGDIYEDRSGYIWVGSKGLERIDPLTNQVIHYRYDPNNNNSLGGRLVFTIYEDRQGIMWFGTYDGGLDRFDRNSGTFKNYKHDPSDSMSLSNDFVLSIYQDSKDNLWVGTVNGLCRMIQLENGREGFVRYKNDPLNPISLSSSYIHDIFEDSKKRLWIATNYGLNLFNREEESFIPFTKEDGLPDNSICSILEDDHKNLWLRTEIGLAKFNPEKIVFRTYDERDGLKNYRSVSSGFKAFHKGKSGKIYYGGMNNLAVFYPDSLKDNPNPPRIVLTDFKLNNKPVEIGDSSYLKKTITETKTIELPYYENILSFEFSALDYTAPGKNQYAYKMEGVDRDWVYTDAARRYVSYTNLDPGEYVFSVKGSNCDGVWNEEGVSVSIIINPPWWATWWAYILYVIFTVSLFTGVTRFYLNRQRLKHQLVLEHEHAEKLGEIDQLKSRFFANISHEFRTPLTLILGPVKQIMNKINDTKVKEELKLVHRNANRLNGMVNQLLDLSKLEAGRMELKTIKINIIPFLKGLVFSFASLAERKKIALKFNSDLEELLVYVDKDKVEKIIYNILSNAFKFTSEGGSVEIEIKSKPPFNSPFTKGGKEEGSAEISISDTGIGISEERVDNIFDRFYQVDGSHTREHEGTGIGLALTKELVELHKGEIAVESEEDKGTTFVIRLPLGRDHLKPEEIIEEKVEEKKDILTIDEVEFNDEIKAQEKFDIETFTETGLSADKAGKPLLLIVEDNVDVRNYIKGYLEESYKIIEAVNGNDGFHKSLQSSPDLIVSDVMMPEMDGFELCEKLKTDERTSHIPIILLTAKASGQDKIGGLEMGADDYIMKPFDAEELQVRIKNLIDQRKKLREHFKKEGLVNLDNKNITSIDKKFLKKILEIIDSHISDSGFSIDKLADEIGLSRSQLHRKLVSLIGESPGDLTRRIRLYKAAKLIEEKFGNISEIALEIGFSNPANFAQSFRHQFGVSPSEYEKQHFK